MTITNAGYGLATQLLSDFVDIAN